MAPCFTMVSGPNGSGKTTLTDALRKRGIDLGLYVNADEIAVALAAERPNESAVQRARRAQAEASALLERQIAARSGTTFETVMSHESKIDLLRRAKAQGFRIRLFYVSTADPTINLTRVIARVAQGGHDVPIPKIKARYLRSMAFLHEAARLADDGAVFDNSTPTIGLGPGTLTPLQMVGTFENAAGTFLWRSRQPACPAWVDEFLLKPLRASGSLRAEAR